MTSERVQRRIDQLLDEADQAIGERDWARVRVTAETVLRLDSENVDAKTFLAAAEQGGDPDPVAERRLHRPGVLTKHQRLRYPSRPPSSPAVTR